MNGGKAKEKRANDLKTTGGRRTRTGSASKVQLRDEILFSFRLNQRQFAQINGGRNEVRPRKSYPDNKMSGRLCNTSLEGSKNKAAFHLYVFTRQIVQVNCTKINLDLPPFFSHGGGGWMMDESERRHRLS